MKILIADDEKVSLVMLESWLEEWGYEYVAVNDGAAAWEAMQADNPPPLAILDWMMPGLEGAEVCRRVRATPGLETTYLILLTTRDKKEEIVMGLESGADAYVIKPFHPEEFHARLQAAFRTVELHRKAAARIKELEETLARKTRKQPREPEARS